MIRYSGFITRKTYAIPLQFLLVRSDGFRNTDRLFALWQAVYPESNFTSSQTSAFGTLTNDAGETEDINTRRFPILAPNEASMESLMFLALTPFHSDDSGTIWTSATAWSTKEFGYSYPEINDWAVNRSQLSSNVKTRLNALYNPTPTTSRRSVSVDASSRVELSPNAMDMQWLANIKVSKSVSRSTLDGFSTEHRKSQVRQPLTLLRPSLLGRCTCRSQRLVFRA